MEVRPYQVMCVVCRLGSDGSEPYFFEERLDEILAAVREDRSQPLTLRCNVDSNYAYQNPGRAHDTPEGGLFNDKRDLDILRQLGLIPGDTRPALEIFGRLFRHLPTCQGICGYGQRTCATWRGCHLARTGNYERGHAKGIEALIPSRSGREMADAKKDSCEKMYCAAKLRIRPHHLMCMTCFHRGQADLSPIEEDNLFEAIDIVQKAPDIPVELVAGPCTICPPCPNYRPESNLCVTDTGMALRDQKKDLDVLQLLGLAYGDVLPARELFSRLYARIHSPRRICGLKDEGLYAPEWRTCPKADADRYAEGRAAGLGIPGVEVNPHETAQ